MVGTGITGLPFPRVSGPFLHPNMFGDYLVVSAALLWGRWAELGGREGGEGRKAAPWLAGSLAVALACALVLTASTAWVGAGVAVAWLAWLVARGRVPGVAWEPAVCWTFALAGTAVAAGVTFLLVVPMEISGFGRVLATGAMRPGIWGESAQAFASSPLAGVGAAPWLASVADPLAGGAVGSYDAHNALVSVLAQFGIMGAALAGVGVWGVLSAGWGVGRGRHGKEALRLALVAVAVNALFLASEDLRHVWALVGLVGLVVTGVVRAEEVPGGTARLSAWVPRASSQSPAEGVNAAPDSGYNGRSGSPGPAMMSGSCECHSACWCSLNVCQEVGYRHCSRYSTILALQLL